MPNEPDLLDVPVKLPAGVTSTTPLVFELRDQKMYIGTNPGTNLDSRLIQRNPVAVLIYNRGPTAYDVRRGGSGNQPETIGSGQSYIKLSPVTDYLSLTPDASTPAPNAGELTVTFLVPAFGTAARRASA